MSLSAHLRWSIDAKDARNASNAGYIDKVWIKYKLINMETLNRYP